MIFLSKILYRHYEGSHCVPLGIRIRMHSIQSGLYWAVAYKNAEDASNRPMVDTPSFRRCSVFQGPGFKPCRTVLTGIAKKIRRLVNTSTTLLRKIHVGSGSDLLRSFADTDGDFSVTAAIRMFGIGLEGRRERVLR
jgi:hypothetical protein